MKRNKGITLIALVITIIILLILAGITISTLTGENGLLTKAVKAKEEYNIAKAREELIIVLAEAHIEKTNNKEYNQDDFLDDLIETGVENAKVKGDIVINDGYAFDLDRTAPKLGEYRGKEKDLVFPEVKAEIEIQPSNTEAIIKITAKEEKSGISKIEIWQEGYIIQEYNYQERRKDEITEQYTVRQNGTYIIKVYADLKGSTQAKVEGLISEVKYEPNGDNNWKKEHIVKISVNENIEKVKTIKYQWLQTTELPKEESFEQTCTNGETLTKNGITGKWYLWTLLETEKGKKTIGRSESFWFDNEGPTSVTLTSTPTSVTGFQLTAEATDDKAGIKKYDFYVNNQYEGTVTTTKQTATYNVTGVTTGNASCYVIVTDQLDNPSIPKTITATTKLYTWEKYNVNSETKFVEVSRGITSGTFTKSDSLPPGTPSQKNSVSVNTTTGLYEYYALGSYSSGWYRFSCIW